MVRPWLSDSTSTICNPNVRLHNEIIEFYDYIRPKNSEHKKRTEIYTLIKNLLEEEIPGSTLLAFGSFCTKLYLPNSDVDLVLIHKEIDKDRLLNKVKKVLKKNTELFEHLEILQNAKVPIIKFTHAPSAVDFDITFNELSGVRNAEEVKNAIQIHPEIKYLLMIMKLFLRQRKMNNTFTGGIGSFLLFCIILAFIRQYKKDVYFKDRDYKALENLSLSEFLMKFLHFYGTFEPTRKEIHMSDGGSIKKKNEQSLGFNLYSPIEPDRNIGGQAFRIREIFGAFRNRYNTITNKAYDKPGSVLCDLINPSGLDFSIYMS